MEIYAPIAHRLGIRSVKDELEDLALRYLDPVAYKEIEDQLDMTKTQREQFIRDVQKRILERFDEFGLHPHIEDGSSRFMASIARFTSKVSPSRKSTIFTRSG